MRHIPSPAPTLFPFRNPIAHPFLHDIIQPIPQRRFAWASVPVLQILSLASTLKGNPSAL